MYGLNKVLGMDGTTNAQGGVYIMALDIQYINTNVGYDFVTHMNDMIHNEIVGAQRGELQNFKFHQYFFLMHLILFYNKEHFGPQLLETKE